MICTKKLLDAFEKSQRARADRVIRRHSRPGAHSPQDGAPQIDGGGVVMNRVQPDIGDVAMPLSCFEEQHYDHRSGLVIACAWLVLYAVMFGDFAFTRVAEAFAALH